MPSFPTIRTADLELDFTGDRYVQGDKFEFVQKAGRKDDKLEAFSEAINNTANDINTTVEAINAFDFSAEGVSSNELSTEEW